MNLCIESFNSIAEIGLNLSVGLMRLIRNYVVGFDCFGRGRFEIRSFETAGGA